MREAIRLHLKGMRGDGEAIPEPTAVAALTITAA
jgi:predicted RNase H-like HicB family nuclease